MNEAFPYAATFMISALEGKGVEDLTVHLADNLPEGVWMYDPDQITDMPMRLMAAEITREKIYDPCASGNPLFCFCQNRKLGKF